jgi:hypothetical protein
MVSASEKLKQLVEKRKSSLNENKDETQKKMESISIKENKKQEANVKKSEKSIEELENLLKKKEKAKEILEKSLKESGVGTNEKIKGEVKEVKEEKKVDNFEEIESFLSDENRFNSELNKNISGEINNNFLIHTDAKNNKSIMLSLIKKVLSEGKVPIFVLTSNNYKTASKFLSKSKVSLDEVYIIDTVSKNTVNINDFDKVLLVDSLRNITQLQIKLLKLLRKIDNAVIIFDTVDVLELYHPQEIILKFIYSIIKIGQKKNANVLMIVNKDSLAPKASQFFGDFFEIKNIK